MKKKNKRAGILVGNVVFIILNLIFLTILILFIARQGSGVVLLEQSYAKQIALIFDSAKPGTTIFLDFEKGIEKIKKNFGESYIEKEKFSEEIVTFKDNIVTVKLDKGARQGYSYSFFNDIELDKFGYYIDEGGIYFVFAR
jgi:hypothetical protein